MWCCNSFLLSTVFLFFSFRHLNEARIESICEFRKPGFVVYFCWHSGRATEKDGRSLEIKRTLAESFHGWELQRLKDEGWFAHGHATGLERTLSIITVQMGRIRLRRIWLKICCCLACDGGDGEMVMTVCRKQKEG